MPGPAISGRSTSPENQLDLTIAFTDPPAMPPAPQGRTRRPNFAEIAALKTSVRLADMTKSMGTRSLMDELKAADMERRPIAEVLAQLSPRTRRKKRMEMRCEVHKKMWSKMAVRVQALIRGVVARRKFDLVRMFEQRRLDRLVAERVQAIRVMMEHSEEHIPFQIIQAVDEVLSTHPHSHEMLLTKARVLVYSGELEAALEATEQLLSHPGGEASSTETRRLRFCVYMRQGCVDRALGEVEAILEKEGQVPRYAHLRAMLLGMQGRFALAEDQLDVAIDRGGGGSEALLRRGMVRGCLQDWERAAIDLRHSMAYKDSARGRETLGRVYVCMRRWNDGLREVKKALKLDPLNALATRAVEEIRLPYDPMPLEVQGGSLDDPYHVQRLASGQFPRFDNQREEEEEAREHKGQEREEEEERKKKGAKDEPAGEGPEAEDNSYDVKGETARVVAGATLPRPLPPLPPPPEDSGESEREGEEERPAQAMQSGSGGAENAVGVSEEPKVAQGVADTYALVEAQREEAHD